jgi:hypothetical protein
MSNDWDARTMARVFRVPYWLVSPEPKPSWLRSPVWRARAVWWRHERSRALFEQSIRRARRQINQRKASHGS